MIKRIVVALVAIILLLALSACAAVEPFEQGEVLSAEEVEARRAALLAEREEEASKVFDGSCYWLVKGSVYHVSLDCSYIKGKENLQSGTVQEANANGKTKACSLCGD